MTREEFFTWADGREACRVLPAESDGVATIGENTRYPDAVTCSPVEGQDRLIPNPAVIFEVVSETNARTDRFAKMREYHDVPSIKRYVLVEQAQARIRQGDERRSKGAAPPFHLPGVRLRRCRMGSSGLARRHPLHGLPHG